MFQSRRRKNTTLANQARAKAFAERPYVTRVILGSNDSPESIRLKGLTERLADDRLYGVHN